MVEDKNFKFHLYLPNYFSNPKSMKELWNLLDNSLIHPKRFDSVERAKRDFTEESYIEGGKILNNEGSLFVKGGRDKFTLYLSDFAHLGFCITTIYLERKAIDGKSTMKWMEWIGNFCNQFPVYFGFGCSQSEYDQKHENVKVLESGGRVTGWLGVSAIEFLRYNPGIYWLNIFGKELVYEIGLEKIKRANGVVIKELDNNQLLIQLNEPAFCEDYNIRLQTEQKIAKYLGQQYFFDRKKPDFEYQQAIEIINKITT
jgi:hypothetical protein